MFIEVEKFICPRSTFLLENALSKKRNIFLLLQLYFINKQPISYFGILVWVNCSDYCQHQQVPYVNNIWTITNEKDEVSLRTAPQTTLLEAVQYFRGQKAGILTIFWTLSTWSSLKTLLAFMYEQASSGSKSSKSVSIEITRVWRSASESIIPALKNILGAQQFLYSFQIYYLSGASQMWNTKKEKEQCIGYSYTISVLK